MLFKTSKKKVQTLLLQMDNKIIDKVLDFNFLGIHFNEQLNWKSILNRLKRILPLNIKIILYNSLMLLSHCGEYPCECKQIYSRQIRQKVANIRRMGLRMQLATNRSDRKMIARHS